MKDLRELLAHEVQDLYSAETQLIQEWPKLSKNVESNRLKKTFAQHLEETKQQRDRLQNVAERMNFKVNGNKSEGMDGLLRQTEKLTRVKGAPPVKDAALIGAAQKIEHYQMAGYGTARNYAQLIGEREVADVLGRCLTEVKNADQTFTNLAMERLNERISA